MSGAFAEARIHFEKVTRADPEDPNSWFHLGYCYSKNRQYTEAIEPFRHAASSAPVSTPDALQPLHGTQPGR